MMQAAQDSTASIESILHAQWPIPIWLTILIGLTLLICIGSLYLSERGAASRRLRITLTLLRFSVLALVVWMLAGWSWQRFKSDRPELVIVLDRSASMDTFDESFNAQKQTRFEFARALIADLNRRDRQALTERYDLKWFTISEGLETQVVDMVADSIPLENVRADGTQSRLGDALSRLVDRQAGRGTAAIVLISDGITTSGATMSYAAQKARRAAVPFHTLVVGQQNVQPDVRLADLLIDREVYLGDQVTAELSVVASDIASATTRISLTDMSNGKLLDTSTVELTSTNSQQQVRLSFVPDRSGEIPLRLSIAAVEGESDETNNVLQASVNVQDKSIKVLMVFATASYEFRFLKSLLERTQQTGESKSASFQLQSVLQDADLKYVEQDATALRLVPSGPNALDDVDVFILGEPDPTLISRSAQQAVFEAVTTRGAGCIFVYSSVSPTIDLNAWPIGKLLPIEGGSLLSGAKPVDAGPFRWKPTALGSVALPMQLAGSPAASLEVWNQLPLAGRKIQIGDIKPGAQALVSAVGATAAESPMIITQFAGAGRTALQASDETYRWTSFSGSDLYYQRYWGQMLRWLSRGKLNRNGEASVLSVEPKQSRLGQPVRLQLMLGSEAGRLQTPESVDVVIEMAGGTRRPLTLRRYDSETPMYQSTLSDLGPGAYRAMLLRPAETAPPAAEFVVTAPPGEQANLRANPEDMKFLAEHSRGRSYSSKNARQLFEQLPVGKPTRLGSLPPVPFWNSHWIAGLFVLLLTCEWLLRRRARML